MPLSWLAAIKKTARQAALHEEEVDDTGYQDVDSRRQSYCRTLVFLQKVLEHRGHTRAPTLSSIQLRF